MKYSIITVNYNNKNGLLKTIESVTAGYQNATKVYITPCIKVIPLFRDYPLYD